jgi:sialic acid synthase SpsE
MSLIVAEIGTSHDGSLEKAKLLTDKAIEAGADAVKFQWVYADEILHPKTGFVNLPTGKIPLFDRFKSLECDISFYEEMKNYIHSKNKLFVCSPFGQRSLRELISISPDIIKIASPELNHSKLLTDLANFRNKSSQKMSVILSSGVSKLADIEKALEILGTEKVSLLHCITSYPAPEKEYNLKLIENLSSIFGVDCGVSDHSLDPVLVPVLSISCGAKIIEKHITLSKKTKGLDDPVALTPEEFATMVHAVHQSETVLRHYGASLGNEKIINQMADEYGKEMVSQVLGTGIKKLAPSEKDNYSRTNRSLHYLNDLKKGTCIGLDDIAILRTEKELSVGESPFVLDSLLGKKLSKDVLAGSGVLFSDFMN